MKHLPIVQVFKGLKINNFKILTFIFAISMLTQFGCQKTALEEIEGVQVADKSNDLSVQGENIELSYTESDYKAEPKAEFKAPSFPAISLHVIYREFVHQNPNLVTLTELYDNNYADYLEGRLMELYPEVSYKGMVAESMAELAAFTTAYDQYVATTLHDYVDEADVVTNIPSLASEKIATQMTEAEVVMWNDLEAHASIEGRLVTRAELDALIAKHAIGGQGQENIWAVVTIIVGVSAYVIFRALQARNRANNRVIFHFGFSGSGDLSDAFRHIYASMHLRRYVGIAATAAIGFGREVWAYATGSNFCHEGLMDIHNNRVGYLTRYSTFRNGTGNHNWGQWAARVNTFVRTPARRRFLANWGAFGSNPNCRRALVDQITTNPFSLIFFR